ncbi:MAG: 50S ribosomal protein L3 [Defluviitaleaceae bacterium]|nr:50S ribosomal protein L3 [Defluviitaleaceae bacterium]
MKKAILAKKLGMTQVFAPDGTVTPVTVLEAGPCLVVQKKTMENDGYAALQVGFDTIKPKHVNEPKKGHYEANVKGQAPRRYLREFRLEDCDQFEVGAEIKADVFVPGDLVDVSAISKGKGFQGAIKRHGQHRGPLTHGSKYHRGLGSMGPGTTPGRVRKGKKMPGHMGAKRITIQNLEIVKADPEKNLLLIKGAIPGVKGALVTIKDTVKQ